MNDEERLEERLGRWANAPDEPGDWEDVLRRVGGRLSAMRAPRRGLVLSVAAAIVVVAAGAGIVFATRGTRPAPASLGGPAGKLGPLGGRGVTGSAGPTGPDPRLAPSRGPTSLEGPTGDAGPDGGPSVPSVGPLGFSASGLATESTTLQQPIYWAGPQPGMTYELTRTSQDDVYVRYLPEGVRVGTPGTNRLIVATYYVPDAFDVLKQQANGKEIAGPDGSVILQYGTPRDVYVAFPNVEYEVVIHDPNPAVALSTAQSGDVQPVAVG